MKKSIKSITKNVEDIIDRLEQKPVKNKLNDRIKYDVIGVCYTDVGSVDSILESLFDEVDDKTWEKVTKRKL